MKQLIAQPKQPSSKINLLALAKRQKSLKGWTYPQKISPIAYPLCLVNADTLLNRRSQVKQELRQRIQNALQVAKTLPPDACLIEIKTRLLAIQSYCQTIQKRFIMVELQTTCAQYDLGGNYQDTATLFRGPSEDASVAICVTTQGSLLYRNGDAWRVYRNMGDVNPAKYLCRWSRVQYELEQSLVVPKSY